MKNIEIFNHEILGEMHVFGDEKGLWFWVQDVGECLEISYNTIVFKYKHLPSDVKQSVKCKLSCDEFDNDHQFIHEKVVYELMCIGNSSYCDEFRQWVGEIAYAYDYLNIRCNESQLGMHGNAQADYNLVKEYVSRVNDPSPLGKAVKNAMNELDEFFNDKWVSDNNKPIICEKSYRTDYTLDEARNDPGFNPSVIEEDKNKSIVPRRSASYPVNAFDRHEYIEQTDEQRQELIDAFDEGRLVEYRIEEKNELEYDENDKMVKKSNYISYIRQQKPNGDTTCPSWIKYILK